MSVKEGFDWTSLTYPVRPRILRWFFVFEGIDGSGMTTQAGLLRGAFEAAGLSAAFSKEPTGGPTGRQIREILRGDLAGLRPELPFLFAADRAEHLFGSAGLLSQRAEGKICVSDRYLFSSLVYQVQEHKAERVWRLNCRFPLPEILFYLDLEPELADRRIAERSAQSGQKREIFERVDSLQRIRWAYQGLLSHLETLDTGMRIVRLDGARPASEIHGNIRRVLDDFFR